MASFVIAWLVTSGRFLPTEIVTEDIHEIADDIGEEHEIAGGGDTVVVAGLLDHDMYAVGTEGGVQGEGGHVGTGTDLGASRRVRPVTRKGRENIIRSLLVNWNFDGRLEEGFLAEGAVLHGAKRRMLTGGWRLQLEDLTGWRLGLDCG